VTKKRKKKRGKRPGSLSGVSSFSSFLGPGGEGKKKKGRGGEKEWGRAELPLPLLPHLSSQKFTGREEKKKEEGEKDPHST